MLLSVWGWLSKRVEKEEHETQIPGDQVWVLLLMNLLTLGKRLFLFSRHPLLICAMGITEPTPKILPESMARRRIPT